jgi:hypothetical protein
VGFEIESMFKRVLKKTKKRKLKRSGHIVEEVIRNIDDDRVADQSFDEAQDESANEHIVDSIHMQESDVRVEEQRSSLASVE